MTYRPVFDALKEAFLRRTSKYPQAETLAEECAQIALDALAEIVTEKQLTGLALGDWQLCDGYCGV